MKFDPDVHHRRSIRLKGFDYASAGAYFLTICTQARECLLGEIVEEEVVLNAAGEMVEKWWNAVPSHFPQVNIGEYVIMPNHLHGIIWIVGAGFLRPSSTATGHPVGAGSPRPMPADHHYPGRLNPGDHPDNLGGETPPLRKPTLGQVVGYFKYQSTREINRIRDNVGVPVWQRNYYDRVIRDEDELDRARRYIRENPSRWEKDRENPVNMGRGIPS